MGTTATLSDARKVSARGSKRVLLCEEIIRAERSHAVLARDLGAFVLGAAGRLSRCASGLLHLERLATAGTRAGSGSVCVRELLRHGPRTCRGQDANGAEPGVVCAPARAGLPRGGGDQLLGMAEVGIFDWKLVVRRGAGGAAEDGYGRFRRR